LIKIEEPIDGAILNRNDGRPTASGLEITVRGTLSPPISKVWVNENEAEVTNAKFACNIILEKEENRIVAFSKGEEGEPGYRDVITFLWDRYSLPRYRFSLMTTSPFSKIWRKMPADIIRYSTTNS